MRILASLACAVALACSACTSTQQSAVLSQPVAGTAVVLDAQTVLKDYQAAKGIALVAEVAYPSIKPTVDKVLAAAAPYEAAITQGVSTAAQAASLKDLALALLTAGKDYIQAIPARQPA